MLAGSKAVLARDTVMLCMQAMLPAHGRHMFETICDCAPAPPLCDGLQVVVHECLGPA
jgi:hypothetical protein